MYIDVNMVSIVTGMMSGACMFRIESSKNLDQEIDNIKNSRTLPRMRKFTPALVHFILHDSLSSCL